MRERVVLVSGGSKGLGLAIVEDCVRQGWAVATFSRSKSPRMEEMEAQRPECFLHFCGDLSDKEFPERALKLVKQKFGGLHALVNNAAVASDGMLATMPGSAIEELVQINLTGTLLLSRECIREFLRQPHAQPKWIVNISSIVALSGFRGLSVYSATKSATTGLTRSLARELGPANVTVNAVLPGFLLTEMSSGLEDRQREQIVRRTPLGRLGEVGDVIPLVRFLLGAEARFVTGQCFVVDGGATC
jgi:3-oxoacyl-[acyl-carrier protein] reductase